MEQDIIYTGEDKEIQFTLTGASNTPINLSTDIDGLLVVLYSKQGSINTVLSKYSRDAIAGYDSTNLVITDAAAGEFSIRLQAESTRYGREETLYAEIKVRFPNTDYSGNNFDSIARDLVIAQVRKSITGSENVF